ncbi:uncharacterized protein [Littorina saxatilis]|uniref:uncharacterized protein isoform X7 n=1 Tax=Littorina saxatilis TaxID=31220 RepID=UPI0038B4E095
MLQQKIVTNLVLQLIISSQYLVMSEETTVTCVAPPVKEGQPGQLTCNFNHDLSKLGDYITTVEFYPAGQTDPIQIIECYLAQGPKECSVVKEGYTFDETIDTHLRLDMTNVSTSNVGSYMCKLSSTKFKPEPLPCSFNIADATTPGPGSRRTSATTSERTRGETASPSKTSESVFPYIPVAVGVGAAVIVTVVVVITIIICRRKRQQSRPAEDAEFQKLTDTSKSAVNTTGKSAPEDDNPPPIPERAPILQDTLYDDQWRGEDGDEQFINATDAEPPPKPPRSYELLSHEDDAAGKEETDETKDPMLKEDAVSEPVETTNPPTTQ